MVTVESEIRSCGEVGARVYCFRSINTKNQNSQRDEQQVWMDMFVKMVTSLGEVGIKSLEKELIGNRVDVTQVYEYYC